MKTKVNLRKVMSMKRLSWKGSFQKLPKNSIKKDMKPQGCLNTHCVLSKRHKREKVQHAACRSSMDNKTT
ncbi:hypothetical protein TNCV_330861 [Trichonephila clavipes]|nr:hypothetical protein TNCV_330861 [Trichonephila clavipes]